MTARGRARAVALVVLVGGLVMGPSVGVAVATGTAGEAVEDAAPPAGAPAPGRPSGAEPDTDDGGGILGGLVDQLCPTTDPPVPEPPINLTQVVSIGGAGDELGEDTAPDVGGEVREGLFARYGTAGLRWTTYDVSCFSPSRFASGLASDTNRAATTVDAAAAGLSVQALDPEVTTVLDPLMPAAAAGLRESLFDPWMGAAIAVAGVTVLGSLLLRGDPGAAVGVGLAAVLALGTVSWFTADPLALPELSDRATQGVALEVSDAMVDGTGGTESPLSDVQALPETYYRALPYQAWLQGMFCGDVVAEEEFGPRFLEAQAFSVDEWDRAVADAGYQQDLVEQKQGRWLEAAAELQDERPAAFACWSGQTDQRGDAALNHWIATVFAGGVSVVAAGAIFVMRNLVRLVVILAVVFGAVLLASRKVSVGMLSLGLTAIAGTLGVSALSSATLVVLTTALATPGRQWTDTLLGVLGFALAVLVARRPLGRLLAGFTDMDRFAGQGRRVGRGAAYSVAGGRRGGATVTGDDVDGPELGAGLTAGLAGYAGGRAAGAVDDGGDGPDAGRERAAGEADRRAWVEAAYGDGGDGPVVAPASTGVDAGVDDDGPVVVAPGAPVGPVDREGMAGRADGRGPMEPYDYQFWHTDGRDPVAAPLGDRYGADDRVGDGPAAPVLVSDQDAAGLEQGTDRQQLVGDGDGREGAVGVPIVRDETGRGPDGRTTAAAEALARHRPAAEPAGEPVSAGAAALARVREKWADDGGDDRA